MCFLPTEAKWCTLTQNLLFIDQVRLWSSLKGVFISSKAIRELKAKAGLLITIIYSNISGVTYSLQRQHFSLSCRRYHAHACWAQRELRVYSSVQSVHQMAAFYVSFLHLAIREAEISFWYLANAELRSVSTTTIGTVLIIADATIETTELASRLSESSELMDWVWMWASWTLRDCAHGSSSWNFVRTSSKLSATMAGAGG